MVVQISDVSQRFQVEDNVSNPEALSKFIVNSIKSYKKQYAKDHLASMNRVMVEVGDQDFKDPEEHSVFRKETIARLADQGLFFYEDSFELYVWKANDIWVGPVVRFNSSDIDKINFIDIFADLNINQELGG